MGPLYDRRLHMHVNSLRAAQLKAGTASSSVTPISRTLAINLVGQSTVARCRSLHQRDIIFGFEVHVLTCWLRFGEVDILARQYRVVPKGNQIGLAVVYHDACIGQRLHGI